MDYITISEIAEKWNISERMIRRYMKRCHQIDDTFLLLYLLLQVVEQLTIEKISDANLQPITKLLQ